MQLEKIGKPALLRSLFFLATKHPAEIVSYNKLMGLLHDAGNATTVAHYLELLGRAFLIKGLPKFPAHESKGSSPKLICQNNALVAATSGRTFTDYKNDPTAWGRLLENAIGSHLLNTLHPVQYSISYFRERVRGRDMEVDFVVRSGDKIWALEITQSKSHPWDGLNHFKSKFPEADILLIGPGGFSHEEFVTNRAGEYFEKQQASPTVQA